MCTYVEILLICDFHPSRARNFARTIISKLNNFAEVLAVHVDVYMATPVLRSLTHETLCDTGQRTRRNLPTTTYPSPNPSTLNHLYLFFCGFAAKNHRWKKYYPLCAYVGRYDKYHFYGFSSPHIMAFKMSNQLVVDFRLYIQGGPRKRPKM